MAFGSDTSGYAVCFCLPNIINPVYIQQMRETFPPPCQNTVGFCK